MRFFLLALGVLYSLPVLAAEDPMVVGVFAPRIYFANSLARTQYANNVAQQLSEKTGLELVGRGFATRGDFLKQLQKGRVQFAVIEAQLQAERGFSAIAQGTHGGKTKRPMVLVVSPKAPAAIGKLKGKSLAWVKVGRQDASFRVNYLLQGQVPAQWFKVVKARDAQGALSRVARGKAHAAFSFAGSTAGLPVAFTSRGVPLPVFVQADGSLNAAVVSKVRSAIRSVRVKNGVFGGFGGYDAAGIAQLKNAQSAAPRTPGTTAVLSPPTSKLPRATSALHRSVLPVTLPPASAGMGSPALPGDAF